MNESKRNRLRFVYADVLVYNMCMWVCEKEYNFPDILVIPYSMYGGHSWKVNATRHRLTENLLSSVICIRITCKTHTHTHRGINVVFFSSSSGEQIKISIIFMLLSLNQFENLVCVQRSWRNGNGVPGTSRKFYWKTFNKISQLCTQQLAYRRSLGWCAWDIRDCSSILHIYVRAFCI